MNDAATVEAPIEAVTTGIGSNGARLGFQILAVGSVEASPTNPRKTFNPVKHEELTESVKQHGVLQPILVRPHPTKRGKYELIAGERRWRASKAAKVATIPAIVRELDDLQTLEVQVIENLQRDDLHPLEEAEGYEALMKKHGFTVDQLATKVGKSKAYIYARLKLCALSAEAREVFMQGTLDASTALLVARIPVPALQKKALNEIQTGGEWMDGNKRAPMSYRRAAEHVRANDMLRLDQAPFDVKALYFAKDKANPIGPACAECPKRTGNAPDLFGDVESGTVCTDPECFGQKREAQGAKVVEEARAKGLEVLTGKEAKKVLPYHYSRPAGFVKLDDHNYQDEKNRTWAKILGKDAKDKVVLCEHPEEPGTFVELVREKDVNAILKAKGIAIPKPTPKRNELSPAERRADRERQVAREVNWQAYLALREVVGREGFTQVELRAIALDALRFGTDIDERLVPYWGLSADDWTEDQAAKAVEKADGGVLLQMVCDLTLGGPADVSPLAAQRGIDVAAIEAKVREEFKAKAEAEKASAKKPAKGKAKAKAKAADEGLEEEDA